MKTGKAFQLFILLFAWSFVVHSQNISTIAGTYGISGYMGDGGPAEDCKLNLPDGIAVDNAGNLYIADANNSVIRKVDASGVITTYAGTGVFGYTGDGGPAINAKIGRPGAMTVDNAGNLYILFYNHTVRKVDPSGVITTIAGTGSSGFSGDGGPAVSAELSVPRGIAVDFLGNLYIAEVNNYRIRKIDPWGIITTIAGNGLSGSSGDGGSATSARISPYGIEVDGAGNIYFVESGYARVRKITPSGIISTIAGNGTPGYSGDGGPAINAQFNGPYDVDLDNAGNVYVSDHSNHVIRKISTAGIITTIAGNGNEGYTGDGGPAIDAQITYPVNIAIDNNGNLYVPDVYNHTVRKISICAGATIYLQPQNQNVCANAPASFQVVATNATAYQWQVNEGSGWTALNDNGIYSGSATTGLTISSADLAMNNFQYRCMLFDICGSRYSSVATLKVVTSPPSLVISTPLNENCIGVPVTFTATPSYEGTTMNYQWLKNGNAVGSNSPVFTDNNPASGDEISCALTSTTNCFGTVTTESNHLTIQVKECTTGVHFPTAFTPNGDGKNDRFKPLVSGMLKQFRFTVFNRWGQVVYSAAVTGNKGWDGTFAGQNQPADTYAWVCIYQEEGKPAVTQKGVVVLIR